MEYLPEFLTVVFVHLLAVMSPGPDFVLVSRNSLAYSRRAGIYASFGISAGLIVHITYSLVGIGLIISKSILIFSILKFAGAAYLIYIGWKSLRARPRTNIPAERSVRTEGSGEMSDLAAFRTGFLTNLLNPKVTLFFLALFTQVINPQTPKLVQALYGAEMFLMNIAWFSLVAILLSHRQIKSRFVHIQHYFERAFGAILIALGIKVALSSSR
jgi:RhtB (resistance to homoserine/threonine) family protein